MSSLKYAAALGAVALLSKVSAHGVVQGIVANVVAGWSIPEDSDLGFVSDYTSPDIVCHKGATPGGSYVSVAAGDKVELEWTVWPDSHHGPVIDYLASCGGDCTTVDKTQLLFNKIDEAGLDNGDPAPGTWASDDLIANNNSWAVTIPSSIAPGKYVLRHEIIALHSAFNVGGAQNYPQCINLEVTGSGTKSLTGGTLGTDLYNAQDPGILINIYYPTVTNYTIPGPALIDGSSSGSQPLVSASPSNTTGSSSIVAPKSASSITTSTSASIAITASPTKPSAIVSPTDGAPSNEPTKPADSGSTTTIETSSTTTITTYVTPSAPEETECPSESESATPPPSDIPTEPTGLPPKPSKSEIAPTEPASSPAPAPATSSSASTTPASFTSTVTGRIGKPTKFVCYIDDDEYTLSSA